MPIGSVFQEENSIFFRISKNNTISYVLGTQHDIPFEKLPTAIKQIVQQCKVLISENGDSNQSPFDSKHFIRKVDEPNWYAALLESQQKIITKCLEMKTLTPFLPLPSKGDELSFYALYIFTYAYPHSLGMDSSIELIFHNKNNQIYALDRGDALDVVYSDDLNYVYSLQDAIDSAVKILSIKNESENYQNILNELFNKMFDNIEYNSKNVIEYSWGTVKKFLAEDVVISQEFFDTVIERNYGWLPKIVQLHAVKDTPALIMVGAAHLAGKEGILSLLGQSGFKLESMDMRGEFQRCREFYPSTAKAERFVLQEKNFYRLKDQVLGNRNIENNWLYIVVKGTLTLAEQLQRRKLNLLPSLDKNGVGLKKKI